MYDDVDSKALATSSFFTIILLPEFISVHTEEPNFGAVSCSRIISSIAFMPLNVYPPRLVTVAGTVTFLRVGLFLKTCIAVDVTTLPLISAGMVNSVSVLPPGYVTITAVSPLTL